MHRLSFSAHGLASNPVVMVTPRVVVAVGGGLRLGLSRGGLAPGHERAYTQTHVCSSIPIGTSH